MADKNRALSIITTGENFLTDPQTAEQVRVLSLDLYACTAARRPIRLPRDGAWRWYNTAHMYSWQTIDAGTHEPIPNA